MSRDELKWYVQQAALRGLLKEARQELLKAGWHEEDVEHVFSSLRPSTRKRFVLPLVALLLGIAGGWTGLYVAYSDAPDIAYRQYSELGDEVVVTFGADVGEAAAKSRFSITPRPRGELVWLADERELHFVPYDGFDPDETYEVGIGLDVRALLPPFSKSAAFTFSAERAEPIVSNVMPATGSRSVNADGPVRSIDANIQTMRLTLLEDGMAVKELPIAAIGNPYSGPTPRGSFDIKTKEPNHFSSKTHVWMPYSMQFHGDYFIHGWPYWPDGTRYEGKYSGGCIRLSQEVAKEVFEWATIGVALYVHDEPERAFSFSPSVLQTGDLVRTGDSPQIYEVKFSGEKRFARPYFGSAENVIPLAAEGLDGFIRSRWVRFGGAVYEVDHLGNRRLLSCGKTPYSSESSPETCLSAWELHGGDEDELFRITQEEWDELTPAPGVRLAVR